MEKPGARAVERSAARGRPMVLLVLTGAALLAGLAVWQVPLHSPPARVTLAYLRAVDTDQTDQARALLSAATLEAIGQAEAVIAKQCKLAPGSDASGSLVPLPLSSTGGERKFRVTSVRRQGERVVVRLRVTTQAPSAVQHWALPCLRESGEWRLDQADALRQAMVMVTGQALPAPEASAGAAARITRLLAEARELKDAKRLPEAEAKYRAALALDPQCSGAHFGLGFVLSTQGRKAEAIAAFEKVLETASDPVMIRETRAALERLRR
jgi:tetratricopeptide (TPR) repeat protein